MRAITTLRDHKEFMRMDDFWVTKGGGVNVGTVEFTKGPETVRLANWRESCRRIWFVVSSGWG